jgi:hypothetical protein
MPRSFDLHTRELVGTVGSQTGALMVPDRRSFETPDEAGFWLESNPDSDMATVGPLDHKGELGLDRVFFVLAGPEGGHPRVRRAQC